MRILITGFGTLGRELVKNKKHEYIVVDKNPEVLSGEMISYDNIIRRHCGNIADYDYLSGLVAQYWPDMIIHTAANKYIDRCEDDVLSSIDDNVIAVANLCKLKTIFGFGLIFISTDKAVNPVSVYGCEKHIGEKAVLKAGGTVVRLVNIINSTGSVLPIWERKLKNGENIQVRVVRVGRKMMPVEYAVNIIYRAMNYPSKIIIPKHYEDVNIFNLARTLADDEKIEITELSPFEKIEEELFLPSEDVVQL